jgi:hypothetical protein
VEAAMNKKSVVFSIISLMLISYFVILSNISGESELERSKLETTAIRVELLNNIVKDLNERYLEQIIYVATKNAFIGVSKFYYEKGFSFVDPIYPLSPSSIDPCLASDDRIIIGNISDYMPDAILHGSFNFSKARDGSMAPAPSKGPTLITPIDLTDGSCLSGNYIQSRYTYDGLLNALREEYKGVGLIIQELDVEDFRVYQKDPWHITAKAKLRYFIQDANGIASWKGDVTKSVDISVIGFYSYDVILTEYSPSTPPFRSIKSPAKIDNTWSVDRSYGILSTNPYNYWCGNPYIYSDPSDQNTLCWTELGFLDKLSGYYSAENVGYNPTEKAIQNNHFYLENAPIISTLGLCHNNYCNNDRGLNYLGPPSCTNPYHKYISSPICS